MDEIIKGIFTAPLATVFVIAGVIFLLVAVVGNISGKIEPGAKGRILSGILGLAFIITGLSMHFTQKITDKRPLPATITEQKNLDQITEAPWKPTAKEAGVPSNAPISVSSTEEQEPNELSHSATPIGLGSTIRGRIATVQDRDMFKFHTATQPASKIRVILRKSSVEGFDATLTVYDAAEQTIVQGSKASDTPVSLGFESIPNSDYYVAVKPWGNYRGDYELRVRVEE
jgi:hypothetical protein